jgi:hypothetical protein
MRVVGKTPPATGRDLRAVLDAMIVPCDEARSLEQFATVMAKLERRQRWQAWGRRAAQLLSALVAAMTGAGAYRLLTR